MDSLISSFDRVILFSPKDIVERMTNRVNHTRQVNNGRKCGVSIKMSEKTINEAKTDYQHILSYRSGQSWKRHLDLRDMILECIRTLDSDPRLPAMILYADTLFVELCNMHLMTQAFAGTSV